MRTQKLITLLALITLITGLAAASGELKIIAKNENGDRIDDVNVTIQSSNTRKSKNTSSSGVARFVNLQAGDYTVNMTHRLYLSREVTVSVEDNTQTTKTVILERKQLEGTLKVHVKDFRGNNLGGAEVRVQSQSQGVNRQKETNSNGIASFTLRVGTYDVYISHPAHRASHVTVDVRAGKTIEKQIQLVESDGETSRDNLEITQIIVPSRIKKGGDVSVSFKVRNLGNTRMKSITASITAFRQTKTTENFAIEAGSSRWLVMNLSVPMDASGEERIQVSVENPDDRDVEFITTTVSDLAAYMDLKPSTAKNGQPVLVTGRIIHTNMVEGASGISANLYLGGSFVTGITTDETGRYSTYVYPEAPGSYTITLRNSYFSVSRSLQVRPALDSLTLNAPKQVNRTAVHEICGRIEASSPLNVNVLLRVDGSTAGSKNINVGTGKRVCFTLPTATVGKHTASLTVSTGGYALTREHTYTVMQQRKKPVTMQTRQSIDLITDRHSILSINLTNTKNTSRNVTVQISGLDRPHQQHVTLPAQTQTTVTFNLTAATPGTYTPTITVKQGNRTLTSSQISVEVHTERQSMLQRAARKVEATVGRLGQNIPNLNYLLGAIILTALVLILARINSSTPEPLEPRQR